MNRRILPVIFWLLVTLPLIAQDGTVVYVEGYVDVRESGGTRYPADFGDALSAGDSIITEADGSAEIELVTGGNVTIAPDTVFVVRQRVAPSGQQESVMAVATGSIRFRFQRLTGTEPRIATPTSVAGVRGTELVVYAGFDGSARFEVVSGEVLVSNGLDGLDDSDGVVLTQSLGVEVAADGTLSEPFNVLERPIDFGSWNADRRERFLANPAAAVRAVGRQMEQLIEQITLIAPRSEQASADLREARDELDAVEESDGREARQTYFETVVTPLQIASQALYVNLRFHALSALSLRRHVLGPFYLELVSDNPAASDAEIGEFLAAYREVIDRYERFVVPYLLDSDI